MFAKYFADALQKCIVNDLARYVFEHNVENNQLVIWILLLKWEEVLLPIALDFAIMQY